jgi:hypothetical protein
VSKNQRIDKNVVDQRAAANDAVPRGHEDTRRRSSDGRPRCGSACPKWGTAVAPMRLCPNRSENCITVANMVLKPKFLVDLAVLSGLVELAVLAMITTDTGALILFCSEPKCNWAGNRFPATT